MKQLLTILFTIITLQLFAQADDTTYVFGNVLGNGAVYSVNVEYVPAININTKPGIQFGGGSQNVYGSDADASLPVRLNLHFKEKGKHHFIIGGGTTLKVNKDEPNREGDEPVGNFFMGGNYHLNIGEAMMLRLGVDFTYVGDSHFGLGLPIPNVSYGVRF